MAKKKNIEPPVIEEKEPEVVLEQVQEPIVENIEPSVIEEKEPEVVLEQPTKIENSSLTLKVKSRSTLGKVSTNEFKASADGWFTSSNDLKKRYNPGVFSNNQIGKFGTLRVFEDGSVEFVTHTDFEKRKKRFNESEEKFEVKLVSESKGVIETKTVSVQF